MNRYDYIPHIRKRLYNDTVIESYTDVISNEIIKLNISGENKYNIYVFSDILNYDNKTKICKANYNNNSVYDIAHSIKLQLINNNPNIHIRSQIRNCSVLYNISW